MGEVAPPRLWAMRGCWRPQPQPWPRSHDSEQKPRAETVIVVIATGDYRDVSRQSNYSKNSNIKKIAVLKSPIDEIIWQRNVW